MLLSGIKHDGTTDVLKQFCVKFICNWYEMVASETYPSHYSIFKESAADADPLPNRFTISFYFHWRGGLWRISLKKKIR